MVCLPWVEEPKARSAGWFAEREGRSVTTSSSSPDDEGHEQQEAANASTTGKKKPILWMVVTGIAVVAAIGVGLWAVSVHEDLEAQRGRDAGR